MKPLPVVDRLLLTQRKVECLSFQRKLESRIRKIEMKEKVYYVYILASKRNGTLYTGVTNDLIRRVMEHKEKVIKGFASKYNVDKLVYYESHRYINEAIRRESNIKAWKRKWKLELIEEDNKEWKDLFFDLIDKKNIKDLKENIYEIVKARREA